MVKVGAFEVPADDVERAKKFYSQLFGWKITKWDIQSSNDYWIIESKPIKGGIIKRQSPGHPFLNYMEVADIDEMLSKVISLGGKVALPKQVVPGEGEFAAFLDSENNIIGLRKTYHKPKRKR